MLLLQAHHRLFEYSSFPEVEKLVEVPQITYEERIIEVPQREVREIIKQVPKPVVQYVDKNLGTWQTAMEYNGMAFDSKTQMTPNDKISILEHPMHMSTSCFSFALEEDSISQVWVLRANPW